jgi:hypothetical protein
MLESGSSNLDLFPYLFAIHLELTLSFSWPRPPVLGSLIKYRKFAPIVFL